VTRSGTSRKTTSKINKKKVLEKFDGASKLWSIAAYGKHLYQQQCGLNPAVESFLEPCRMSSAERVTFRAVVQWTASL
jgi:hypothetical protein